MLARRNQVWLVRDVFDKAGRSGIGFFPFMNRAESAQELAS
jgi:hypothetical protein